MEIHKQDLIKRDKLIVEKKSLENQIKNISANNIKNSLTALRMKMLLDTKASFDSFIEKKKETKSFYQNLHIDTLNDILKKEQCICGAVVKEHSAAYINIKSLEHSVLPYDNASHLNKISNEYSKCEDIDSEINKVNESKVLLVSLKKKLSKIELDLQQIIERIEAEEKRLNRGDVQRQINQLDKIITNYAQEEARTSQNIYYLNKDLERKKKVVDQINKYSEYNQKQIRLTYFFIV